jgi:hypothetical protein
MVWFLVLPELLTVLPNQVLLPLGQGLTARSQYPKNLSPCLANPPDTPARSDYWQTTPENNDGYTSDVYNGKEAVYTRSMLNARWLVEGDKSGWGRLFSG